MVGAKTRAKAAGLLGVLLVGIFAPAAFGQVQDDRHEAYARAHITWLLYHETGHAIQDFTADRFVMTAQQREDHADKIAAFLMLPKRGEVEEFQMFYDAAIDLYMDKDPPDPNHVYAPSRVRAERMLCMLYGAFPDNPWTDGARQLKNRNDQACIEEYRSFREETVDLLGFARELTLIDEPEFIDTRHMPADPRHADAYDYLESTQILLELAIDVEEWLPALRVSDKKFQIVAQECPGYDGFRYSWDQSAVIACYSAVQRCMTRPGHLIAAVDASYDPDWYDEDDDDPYEDSDADAWDEE
jgi:hypothetical protein